LTRLQNPLIIRARHDESLQRTPENPAVETRGDKAPEPTSTLTSLFREYLFASRDQTAKAFDEANHDTLPETICSIGKVFSMHLILTAHDADLMGLRFEAFALSKAALDTLVSALHLARQRANIEVACLLRSALEVACTALHISTDPKSYENYLEHNYQSTKAISAAKKRIPEVGGLWGALSQAAVHVNRRSHGPTWLQDEQGGDWVASVDFSFTARTAQPFQDRKALTLISLTAEIVARVQELSLLEEDAARPGWRRIPGTSTLFCSGTERAIRERHDQLLSRPDSHDAAVSGTSRKVIGT
jgi:hypothetical protein